MPGRVCFEAFGAGPVTPSQKVFGAVGGLKPRHFYKHHLSFSLSFRLKCEVPRFFWLLQPVSDRPTLTDLGVDHNSLVKRNCHPIIKRGKGTPANYIRLSMVTLDPRGYF